MRIAFLPWYGEFGHLIMEHIRYVHGYAAEEKIVCCERGQECLFPSATSFYYDWRHPVPDSYRCGSGAHRYRSQISEADSNTSHKLQDAFPGCRPYRVSNYGCRWHLSDSVKFMPDPRRRLEPVDVAICPRYREFVTGKNWHHWHALRDALRARGLTIGLTGAKATSVDLEAKAKAWDHPDGETAGTCDLLGHCRLYLGSDTGVSHLAALMDVPMAVMRRDENGNPDMRPIMRRASKGPFLTIPDAYWFQPDIVIEQVLEFYKTLSP